MIRSLFVCSSRGILLERHYVCQTARSVIQHFLLLQASQRLPALLTVDGERLSYLRISEVYYVAVLHADCNANQPLDFLLCVAGLFEKYGVRCVEDVKDNYFILYQVLEEICDGGVPLTTKPSILAKIVPQYRSFQEQLETLRRTMKSTGKNAPKTTSMQSNITTDLPAEALTSVNWRAPDITHVVNRCTISLKEYVMCQASEDGAVRAATLTGRVMAETLVSGMPECTVTFANPQVVLDASLIRNVSLQQWNRARALTFVPVDGMQDVCSYKAACAVQRLPVHVRVSQNLLGGSKDYQVTINQTQMPKSELFGTPRVRACAVFVGLGDYDCVTNTADAGQTVLNFSEQIREVRWNIEPGQDGQFATLRLRLEPRKLGHIPRLPTVTCIYGIDNYSLSELSVHDVQFSNSQSKIQKAWQSDVDQISVEIRQ